MVLMIIGVLIVVFSVNKYTWNEFVYLSCLLLGTALFAVGLILPIHGYEETIFEKKYELSCMYKKIYSNEPIYVVEDSDGTITCKHSGGADGYKAEVYTYENNVEFKYVDEGSKPVITKYVLKPKRTLFTFALCGNETKHVISCPKSYVEIWQNKHIK